MKKYFYLFSILLLLHHTIDAQKIIKYSDKNFEYTLIRDSVRYVDYLERNDSAVEEIIITRLKDNKVIQKIKPKEQGITRWFGKNFIVQDANFDGYNDIMLYQYGKGINETYLAWFYNPTKNIFEECEELEDITSPKFDNNKKIIYSNWKGGAGYFGSDIYTYKNNKYIQLSSLELERYIHKKDTILLTKRISNANGKLITTKKFYPETDFDRLLDSIASRKY